MCACVPTCRIGKMSERKRKAREIVEAGGSVNSIMTPKNQKEREKER